MNFPVSEDIQYFCLLGALCVAGAVVGVIYGLYPRQIPIAQYFTGSAVALGVLTACATIGLSWLRWSDYDQGVRASMESVKAQGYVMRHSTQSDGTLVYEIQNYVVPDGSFTVVANRSPFRPSWAFVGEWSLFCGIIAALISLVSRGIAHRFISHSFEAASQNAMV